MKTSVIAVTILLLLGTLFATCTSATAATVGFYNYTTAAYTWDGTDANRLKANTLHEYASTYGDESNVSFSLPWSFSYYGALHDQLTVDTNGRIWFGTVGSSPYIATWDEDLSSSYYGGVYVQHRTDPERVVIEWQTETYTDEGYALLNAFEAVLFPDGRIRFDYGSFNPSVIRDAGSGISNGSTLISLAERYGPAPNLAGRSFLFRYLSEYRLELWFTGSGQGVVTIDPDDVACNANCADVFPVFPPIRTLTLLAIPSEYSLFGGWSGACSESGNCSVTMDGNKSVTVAFNRYTAHQVRINGTYYPSIQAAYDASATGQTIKLWGVTFTENVACNRPVDIVFDGGYNGDYTSKTGETVLNGTLTITGTGGAVTVKGLTIL